MSTGYELLDTFRSLFDGKVYLHRKSNLGDFVAQRLYDDLLRLARSPKLVERISSNSRVINVANLTVGVPARRGDGTFGERVAAVPPVKDPSSAVGRGKISRVEIGVESKILAKAMIKQIDRVIGDLLRQVEQFKRSESDAITVAIVGINRASQYVSHEGSRSFPTDGKAKYRHPSQEAEEAERRVVAQVAPEVDHLIVLRFRAKNAPPFPFEWVDVETTIQEYSASLTRISVAYEKRF